MRRKNGWSIVSDGWLFLRLLIGIATVMVAISYLMDENRLAVDVPKYVFLLIGASLATIYAVIRHRDVLHRFYSGALIVAVAGEVLTVSIVRNTFFACPPPLAVQQYNALGHAIETHNLAAVNAILAHDSQPDYIPLPTGGDSYPYYESPKRPFDVAVESGDVAIADTLRLHGAVLSRDDQSKFELLIADSKLAMLRYLVQHGVAINDRDGNSEALWYAVNLGRAGGVACLLALGANPNTPHPLQLGTPARSLLAFAQLKNESAIVRMLERAGAKKDLVTAGR